MVLIGYIIEAAKAYPAIAELIARVERGEPVTKEQVAEAFRQNVDGIPEEFDNTPTG